MLIDSPDFNSTTGVYTIPQTGVYLFTFDGFVYGTCRHGFIRFYINGRDSGHIIEQNTDGQSSRGISGMRAMHLEQYEMVSLSNDNDDCIFGDDMHPFLFTGSYFGTRSWTDWDKINIRNTIFNCIDVITEVFYMNVNFETIKLDVKSVMIS